jgi:hypothetical protein
VLLRLATDLTAGERTKLARGTAFDPRDVTLAVALDELRDAEQARVRSALRPLLVGSAVDARSPFRA